MKMNDYGLTTGKIEFKLQNANFPTATNPWVKRGGNFNNGTGAGVFNFNRDNGNANSNNGFRVVLAYYDYRSTRKKFIMQCEVYKCCM